MMCNKCKQGIYLGESSYYHEDSIFFLYQNIDISID